MSPSRYVQRCQGACRAVLGVSSFPRVQGGGRAIVCRACRDEADRLRRAAAAKLGSLAASASRLRRKLACIERERLALRLALGRKAS